ncbi:MAG: hypothetical protein AAF480_02845 [Actinomycetota bacterium]
MARLRLLPILFVAALAAVACGSQSIVVTGPSLETVDGAAPVSEGEPQATAEDVEIPEDFQLDTSIFANDDEGDETADDDGGADAVDDAATGDAESDAGVPAGVTLLRSAASATSAVDSYRFEVNFAMYIADAGTVLDVAPDAPLTIGAVAGDRTWLSSDIGPIFEAIFAAAGNGSVRDLLGDDLSMEAITDGTSLYLRAPLFASMAQLGALPGGEGLVALGDSWGYVDLTATGLTAEELAGLTGAQTGASAEDLLALVAAVGGNVTDQGASEVRGVATTRYRAEIGLADVLDAQGMTVDEIAALSAGTGIANVTIPFDIDVDADGRVRRMTVVIDTAFISDLVGEPAPAGTEARISTTVELYDFGSQIDIVDPTTLGAVDVTSSFLSLANG